MNKDGSFSKQSSERALNSKENKVKKKKRLPPIIKKKSTAADSQNRGNRYKVEKESNYEVPDKKSYDNSDLNPVL